MIHVNTCKYMYTIISLKNTLDIFWFVIFSFWGRGGGVQDSGRNLFRFQNENIFPH